MESRWQNATEPKTPAAIPPRMRLSPVKALRWHHQTKCMPINTRLEPWKQSEKNQKKKESRPEKMPPANRRQEGSSTDRQHLNDTNYTDSRCYSYNAASDGAPTPTNKETGVDPDTLTHSHTHTRSVVRQPKEAEATESGTENPSHTHTRYWTRPFLQERCRPCTKGYI